MASTTRIQKMPLVLLGCLLCFDIVVSFGVNSLHTVDNAIIDNNILVEPTSLLRIPLIGASSAPSTNKTRTKVETLSKVFKKSVQKIRQKTKRMDIVFLIDSSSSVGKKNFHSELKFVKKFLSDFNVSYNHTRVAIVTFSSQGKIVRHVDHISKGDQDNDKCRLLNYEMPKIHFNGGGTFTAGALIEAKKIMTKGRKHSRKLVVLITDGFSNGQDPVPIAQELKADNVTILTIGIQSGNSVELNDIASEPNNDHSFLLDSFTQFEGLARRALHNDYRLGTSLRIKDSTLCDVLCDKPMNASNHNESCCDSNAQCSCSTLGGHYSCVCEPGYYGEGLVGKCDLCPNGTYWHSWNLCKPCPDANHVINRMPALNVSHCECKSGFKAKGEGKCEILTCPALEPPENGYFVEQPSCGRVLNTACGARCKPGYQLAGSSIRLCQENGTWSGTESTCVLKSCPSLSIPFYGMVVCKNTDLNLHLDYTPRNETFMEFYDRDELRVTEPMPSDTDCTFKCGPGFYMIGSTKRNCLPLSKWDGLQTACKQILCQPLPEVNFGHYEPSDCVDQKMGHGTNCTLVCDEGFEAKGPFVKTCNGKRTGVWSNKNKYPKCVDVTPPTLECPQNFSVIMSSDDDFAHVKLFPQPNVTDNSDGNITYWIKPSVKSEGVRLTIGEHIFTYVAVDAFKNKAKCNFTVTVIDVTPPMLDNCIDPPEIKIPLLPFVDRNLTFVDWDAPIIYDNSNAELTVTQTLQPGFLGVGQHQVVYNASDASGNHNSCTMNITVKPLQCESLLSPANGQSLCAKNLTHTWCDITCDVGYAIFDELAENYLENFKLYCVNEFAKWEYDVLPDCTQLELPESIEQVFSITLDSETPICDNDSIATTEVQDEFRAQMRAQLCDGVDDCEIASDIADCSEVYNNSMVATSQPAVDDKTFYHVVKREIRQPRRNISANAAKQMNMKIRVYTRISKKLGLWDPKIPRTENLKRVKAELRTFHTNKELRDKLDKLRINVRHLNLDELTLCRSGSVSKKGTCIQCPRGSYHNTALNICQLCPLGYYNNKTGRTECFSCPEHHSTRKLGSRYTSECIEQCPPGTIAKVKVRANQKLQNSLMPFCRKCQPGQYQSLYNQIKCDNCTGNQTSPRGSVSARACYPKQGNPCVAQPGICGPHGICQQENNDAYLYSCLCQEEFMGSHCELQTDLCASAPCQNGGICNQVNSTTFECRCRGRFQGETCETAVDACTDSICRNGGTCIDTEGKTVCECAPGYEGKTCDLQQNHCSANPCEAGQCLNTPEGYFCKCPPGVIGRRCHLRPCDYLPCHKNALCLDLQVFPASRNSFVCRCPAGLKGFDCTQLDSPCDAEPCRNNGICVPSALRNASRHDDAAGIDDRLYSQYKCQCPPYFYGKNCETLTTPDYVMEFSKSGIHNYVEAPGPVRSLNEISLCTWLQTNDSFNYGTILSYASESSDNMFTLTDYNGFVVYVSGNNVITDIQINDGRWHFICLSWSSEGGVYEIYVDGELRDTGFNLSPGALIEANGTLIIGQEQDSPGTSFSETESYVGRIAYLDIWNRFLRPDEILEYYKTCEPYQGDLYSWSDFKNKIKGNVKITASPFCKPCPQSLRLMNGYIRYMASSAFHFCYDGYRLQGSSRRDCLRTSQWSPIVPFCQSINCGHLPNLSNGVISVRKVAGIEQAEFTCNENYYLEGPKQRTCLSNGTWSGVDPECISLIECDRIVPPPNSQLVYANERGSIAGDKLKYPMGTFIEIHCVNANVAIGDNFLTCTESGVWDLPAPQCVKQDTTTTRHAVEGSTRRTSISVTTLSPTAAAEAPDKEFWMNLRRFFYYGCSSAIEKNKRSELCSHLSKPNDFTDLTNYESPDSDDFKNMDFKLVTYLKKAATLARNESVSEKLDFENLFGFIIYGNLTQREISLENLKQSASIESSIRLVLCFYIDTILLDSDLHISTATDDPKQFENIAQKIKTFLIEIVSIVFKNYKVAMRTDDAYSTSTRTYWRDGRRTRSAFDDNVDGMDDYDAYFDLDSLHSDTTFDYDDLGLDMTMSSIAIESTPTTKDPLENGCSLGALLRAHSNTIVVNMTMGEILPNSLDTDDHNRMVPIETKVNLGCADGFLAKGNTLTICESKSHWSPIDLTCKRITCGAPLRPNEMSMSAASNAKYFVGHKLQLKCNTGYQLIGSPFIYCMPTGKWSGVMSHCSKMRCATPTFASGITIIENHPNKLVVKCPNGKTVESICQSNGKWHPSENRLCSS